MGEWDTAEEGREYRQIMPEIAFWDRQPLAGRVLDWLAMGFFVGALVWGTGMLACTRTWGFSIGLILLFAGIFCAMLRPVLVRQTASPRLPWAVYPFVALVAYVVLRDQFTPVHDAARWDALKWGAYLGLGIAWVQLGKRPRRWKMVVALLLLLGTFEAFYGVYQHLTGSSQILWMTQASQYAGRVSGTFLCPNHFACLIGMLIPVAFAVIFAPGAGLPLRMLAIYYLLPALPALIWSISRSALVGTLLGLGAMVMLWLWRVNRKHFAVALVVVPLLMAAIAAGTLAAFPAVKARFNDPFKATDGSWAARRNMWQDTPAMVRDAPEFGHGGGQWVWAYPKYQRKAKLNLLYDYPHNEYVQVVAEYGLAGAGLLLVALLCAAGAWMAAMRRVREPGNACFLAGVGGAMAMATAHAVFDFNFHIFPIPLLLVTLCGLAWGAVLGEDTEPMGASKLGWLWRSAGGLALAGLALFCGIVSFRAGMSYWCYVQGELARTSLRSAQAEKLFVASAQWDARNANAHLGLAAIRLAQAKWFYDADSAVREAGRHRIAAEAEAEARQALACNPLEPLAYYTLGRARFYQDDPEGTLAAYRQAFEVSPMDRFYVNQYADQLSVMGRFGEAVAFLRERKEAGGIDGSAGYKLNRLEEREMKGE